MKIVECGNEAQVYMRNHGAVDGLPVCVESIELYRVDGAGLIDSVRAVLGAAHRPGRRAAPGAHPVGGRRLTGSGGSTRDPLFNSSPPPSPPPPPETVGRSVVIDLQSPPSLSPPPPPQRGPPMSRASASRRWCRRRARRVGSRGPARVISRLVVADHTSCAEAARASATGGVGVPRAVAEQECAGDGLGAHGRVPT